MLHRVINFWNSFRLPFALPLVAGNAACVRPCVSAVQKLRGSLLITLLTKLGKGYYTNSSPCEKRPSFWSSMYNFKVEISTFTPLCELCYKNGFFVGFDSVFFLGRTRPLEVHIQTELYTNFQILVFQILRSSAHPLTGTQLRRVHKTPFFTPFQIRENRPSRKGRGGALFGTPSGARCSPLGHACFSESHAKELRAGEAGGGGGRGRGQVRKSHFPARTRHALSVFRRPVASHPLEHHYSLRSLRSLRFPLARHRPPNSQATCPDRWETFIFSGRVSAGPFPSLSASPLALQRQDAAPRLYTTIAVSLALS